MAGKQADAADAGCTGNTDIGCLSDINTITDSTTWSWKDQWVLANSECKSGYTQFSGSSFTTGNSAGNTNCINFDTNSSWTGNQLITNRYTDGGGAQTAARTSFETKYNNFKAYKTSRHTAYKDASTGLDKALQDLSDDTVATKTNVNTAINAMITMKNSLKTTLDSFIGSDGIANGINCLFIGTALKKFQASLCGGFLQVNFFLLIF